MTNINYCSWIFSGSFGTCARKEKNMKTKINDRYLGAFSEMSKKELEDMIEVKELQLARLQKNLPAAGASGWQMEQAASIMDDIDRFKAVMKRMG